MQTTKKIWLNGELVNWDEASTHLLTHTLHYGGGVFEGIRFYETPRGPAVFRLDEHVKRLFYSANSLDMDVEFTEEEIRKAILETIKVNEIKSGYIRPLIYFGYGKMGLYPKGAPVGAAIAIWPWGAYLEKESVKIKTSKYIRIHPDSTISDAKLCGHYVNSILATAEAKKAGFDEALFLDYKSNVAEGPGENIFMVKNGALYTPKPGAILPGITRASIMAIARDLGIQAEEQAITLKELKQADECFFCGTAAEVTAIGRIDDAVIGDGTPGDITGKIKNTYMDAVHGKAEKYSNWLSCIF